MSLVKYQDQFAEAINRDYGNRAIAETKIGELLTCLEHIKYYSKNLTDWMKPSKRQVGIIHQPAKAWVRYQPLGVIGIIAPWNYPLLLSIRPTDLCFGCRQPCHDQNFQCLCALWRGAGKRSRVKPFLKNWLR